MQLRLQLLGPPQVWVGDEPLNVDTRKATAMLIYLSVTGEVQRRETLAALFWPESDGPRSKAALRRTLSALRKALDGRWLEADREVLSLSADWMDCTRFRELVESTRDHGHATDRGCARCIEPLSEAAELYRGDFLQGFTLPDSPGFDDWQYFNLLAFQRLLSEALQRLSAVHQERAEYEVAAEYANRLLGLDPLNESAHRNLMSIYARSGNRQLALRQYQDCVRVLQEEIGAPPLDETVELNERIVAGELEDYATGKSADAHRPVPALAAHPAHPVVAAELPLIARDEQLTEMRAWYEGVQAAPRALIVAGEQGIGKTRLATDFARELAATGARLVTSRCYPDEATYAYRPWIDALRAGLELPKVERRLAQLPELWLGEAARLMPELAERFPGLEQPPSAGGATGQDRFLESLAQVISAMLAGPRPGVVLLDDLHWADEASMDFLTYLLRHATQQPMLVVAGWRTEGLAGEQQLRALQARFPRRSSRTIQLDRLSAEQVEQLAGGEGIGDTDLVEMLYRETEGLPLFVAEYLGAIERGAHEHTPPTIQQAIDGRLSALSGTGKQLLSTAGVIGRSFEFETLRMVSGRSLEETVAGLEELIGAGTIREQASGSPRLGPAYDFAHEKLREAALESTTQARQRLLHARTASALTRLQGHRQGDLLADRIAQHLLRAGDEAGAAAMYVQAAQHARSVYANEEALAHFRSALALGDEDQAAMHEAIGDLLTLLGRYDESLQSYEAAGALRPEDAAARIEHKLGSLYQRWGRWERAQNHFAAAAELAKSDAERARIHADWSLTAHRQGHSEQAERLIQQALELAQAADDSGALAQCHNILGILERAAGEARAALEHLEHSLEYADRLPDPSARAAALNNLALALAQDGQLERALQTGREALEICESLGDRHRAAALHSNLADLLHQAGEQQQAQQHLTASAELFAAVGVETGEFEPEIWKLVEW